MDNRATEAMINYCDSIINLIKKHYTFESIPRVSRNVFYFTDDGRYDRGYKVGLFWGPFLDAYAGPIKNMPITKNTIDILKEDGVVPSEDLWQVVLDYIEKYGTLGMDIGAFLDVLKKHEAIWTQTFVIKKDIVPIIGLDGEIDEIELPRGYKLERFTAAEKNDAEFKLHYLFEEEYSVRDFAVSRYKFVATYKEDIKNPPSHPVDVSNEVGRCLTVLRLISSHKIAAAAMYETITPEIPGVSTFRFPIDDFRLPKYESDYSVWKSNRYYITKENILELQELYKQMIDTKNQTSLEQLTLAIHRFNIAYSRRRYDDKIIDFTVALESSLLYGLNNTELSYKFALRGATLLNKKCDPEITFKTLKTLYDMRSKIVHKGFTTNDIIKKYQIDIHKFATEIEQITRFVLREYVRRIGPETDVVKINGELDNDIINGLKIKNN